MERCASWVKRICTWKLRKHKILKFRTLAKTQFRDKDGEQVRDSLLKPGDQLSVQVNGDDPETALRVILTRKGTTDEKTAAARPFDHDSAKTPVEADTHSGGNDGSGGRTIGRRAMRRRTAEQRSADDASDSRPTSGDPHARRERRTPDSSQPVEKAAPPQPVEKAETGSASRARRTTISSPRPATRPIT